MSRISNLVRRLTKENRKFKIRQLELEDKLKEEKPEDECKEGTLQKDLVVQG